MSTAVDTSVLIAIAKGEPEASAWVALLAHAQEKGELVICDVVAAEYFAVLLDERKFRESLSALGICFSGTGLEAAQVAGGIFKQYRREGGPREHLIPDFLIGAHAQRQAGSIAAIDRGYLRRYFPRLKVLTPLEH
ncbi:MAG TPA: type II toxin-antitoxin system VapC family toxin [Verrucomicrobiae bacterium]|nr:type II toxin-antitoxin system VapC family toxin [Verrucomicrobiae bacterium]